MIDLTPGRKEAVLVFLKNIGTMGAKTISKHEEHREIHKNEVDQGP